MFDFKSLLAIMEDREPIANEGRKDVIGIALEEIGNGTSQSD